MAAMAELEQIFLCSEQQQQRSLLTFFPLDGFVAFEQITARIQNRCVTICIQLGFSSSRPFILQISLLSNFLSTTSSQDNGNLIWLQKVPQQYFRLLLANIQLHRVICSSEKTTRIKISSTADRLCCCQQVKQRTKSRDRKVARSYCTLLIKLTFQSSQRWL